MQTDILNAFALLEVARAYLGELKVGCLEEIAFDKGYLNKEQLLKLVEPSKKSHCGEYLIHCANDLILKQWD